MPCSGWSPEVPQGGRSPAAIVVREACPPVEETVSDFLREQRLVIPEFSPLRAGSISTPHQHHHRPGLYGVGERSEHRRLRFFEDVLGGVEKCADGASPLLGLAFLYRKGQGFPVGVDHHIEVAVTDARTMEA